MVKNMPIAEDGWCPVCRKGTECGQTYCGEHKPESDDAEEGD